VVRFGWEGTGAEHLLSTEPPLILAANHRSHADAVAIFGTLPGKLRARTATAAARDVFWPDHRGWSLRLHLLHLWGLSMFRTFPVDRRGSPLRSLKTGAQLLERGWNVLIFPEGTRSRAGGMLPFKAGVGMLARFSGRPVVPVRVEGSEGILPYGARWPAAGRVRVAYGAPIAVGDQSPERFADRLRDEVSSLGDR
jgi:1-acyl-sn-glycerol-3-phosphate acyltransferase